VRRFSSTKVYASPSRIVPEKAAQDWGRDSKVLQTKQSGSNESTDPQEPEDDETKRWCLLDPSRVDYRWDVPWGPGKVVGGLALWLGSFAGVGFIVVPAVYKALGINIYELSSQDKAIFTLVCQAAETVVSLALIRVLTAKQLDESPKQLQDSMFNYSPAAPLQKPTGWAVWAGYGLLLAPAVVGTMAGLMELTGYENNVGGRGTVDGVATMINLDVPTYLSLLGVTGVLAPILEETVFRGFLLTSLTKYMPTWAAIGTSSVVFGLAHLSPRDFPVLVALGCLLGLLYVRSRNLLTPIIVHGAWNSAVLTLLFFLVSSGVNVEELLAELRNS